MWRGWCVRRYGDLDTAGLFAEVGWQLFRQAIARATKRVSRLQWRQNRSCAAEMEQHGYYREQRDGEHGHCRPIAGASEVQCWDVASNVI